MTASEFKYLIETNIIGNTAQKVLINYNLYGSIYKIESIAVLVENNNLTQLQQATAISLRGPLGDPLYIKVDNSIYPVREVDRQLIQNSTTKVEYYLYTILTEDQRVSVENPNSENLTEAVIIEPGLDITPQVRQDYEVLQGTVGRGRESDNIAYSDRTYATSGSNTNPTNLYSINNNIATPAQVQDSNYSNTGWINSRYGGSKITTLTNHNADPFLQGTFFEGSLFSKDTLDSYITGLSTTDLEYGQYFFSGKLETLKYTLENINAVTRESYTNTAKALGLKSITLGGGNYPLIPTLNIGDLFRAKDTEYSLEILQMITPTESSAVFPYMEYSTTSNGTSLRMQIKRGYNTTPKDASVAYESDIYRIVPTKVYSISGNSVQAVSQGKLRIKGTAEVVHLSIDGFVISGSSTTLI